MSEMTDARRKITVIKKKCAVENPADRHRYIYLPHLLII